MTKELHFKSISTTILLMFFSFISFSQGEWQWARSYSGQDGPNHLLYNRIIRSVYDSEGNIYIAGTMGENAFLDNHCCPVKK